MRLLFFLAAWAFFLRRGSAVVPSNPKMLSLRSDILAKATLNSTKAEDLYEEDIDTGGREAMRILRWAEKRGLGPAAITREMILQKRSLSSPEGARYESDEVSKHNYLDLVAMLESDVFIFPDQKIEDQESRGRIMVPKVEDINMAVQTNDFQTNGADFWHRVFQMSDDLAVTTFLRVQNFPAFKAQQYLDQFIAAGANEELKTDIIVDILSSPNYSGSDPDPQPQEHGSQEGEEGHEDMEEKLATPMPVHPEDQDQDVTVEDVDGHDNEATSTSTPSSTVTSAETTVDHREQSHNLEGEGNEKKHQAKVEVEEKASTTSVPTSLSGTQANNGSAEGLHNGTAKDHSDNILIRTFEIHRARRRMSSSDSGPDQFRTLKIKPHKSVAGARATATAAAADQKPSLLPQSFYYEGYLIMDVRVVMVLLGLWLFMCIAVVVRLRIISTSFLLGLFRSSPRSSQSSRTKKL